VKHRAVVTVEYEFDADAPPEIFDAAMVAFGKALRETTPAPPSNVTVFLDAGADPFLKLLHGE
jgi:hypothetical protein